MKIKCALLACATLLLPHHVFAQGSSWGVVGTVTPTWSVADRNKIYFDTEHLDFEGSEFSIGIARGREASGDWGVSFVRMNVKDGSRLSDVGLDCTTFANGCFQYGTLKTTEGVALNGLKAHKFFSFVTIKQRVQLGLNIAGGVGKFKGDVVRHDYFANGVSFNQQAQKPNGQQVEELAVEPASELFPAEWAPIGDIQAGAAFLLAPGLKVRGAGGIGWPGDHVFTITGIYLFTR